jgi:ParB family transcriptional regulator, chromosome partitioning protein
LIGVHGQNDPIKVVARGNAAKTPWKLVAGLHRLEACRTLGIEVSAIEVLGDADALRDIQASENIDRRELEPIERAMFVHAVAEAAKARVLAAHGGKSPQQIGISARWNKVRFAAPERGKDADSDTAAMIATVYGWKDDVAKALGMAPRTVREFLALYRGLVAPFPEESRLLATREIGCNRAELTKLIKLPVGERGAVIEALLQYPSLSSVEEAMLHLKLRTKPLPDHYIKFTSQIKGALPRLGTADWRRFCPDFVGALSQAKRDELRKALDEQESSQ